MVCRVWLVVILVGLVQLYPPRHIQTMVRIWKVPYERLAPTLGLEWTLPNIWHAISTWSSIIYRNILITILLDGSTPHTSEVTMSLWSYEVYSVMVWTNCIYLPHISLWFLFFPYIMLVLFPYLPLSNITTPLLDSLCYYIHPVTTYPLLINWYESQCRNMTHT